MAFKSGELSRSDVCMLANLETGAIKSALRRGQLPVLTENLPVGWLRFRPREAFTIAVAVELSRGNISFGSMSFPAACRIIDNHAGTIEAFFDSSQGEDQPEDFWVGYAWLSEGGASLSGNIGDIAARLQSLSAPRAVALVALHTCLLAMRARARQHGIDIASNHAEAGKVTGDGPTDPAAVPKGGSAR